MWESGYAAQSTVRNIDIDAIRIIWIRRTLWFNASIEPVDDEISGHSSSCFYRFPHLDEIDPGVMLVFDVAPFVQHIHF